MEADTPHPLSPVEKVEFACMQAAVQTGPAARRVSWLYRNGIRLLKQRSA